ncbi:hypothetical protein DFQ26_007970 [Actinomortierella ambigua]|nr:hypothetical protein DFQ26_007970 [Actinomortierella ambigua]
MSIDQLQSNTVIHIPGLGAVRGKRDEQVPVVRFLDIPFATASKRWRPGTPVEGWKGIRDATKQGFSPPQGYRNPPLGVLLTGLEDHQYEDWFNEKDCLNLNIYAPDESVLGSIGEPLPVMVWIYGGAYRLGGTHTPLYDATNFVAASIERKKPVIVVAPNYRTNFFGFMASRELKEDINNDPTLTGEQRAVGNWGLQDQKQAFLWVRDHISAFKGNNRDITAFGESAGAVSIAYHMMIPAHHGLFEKAILQSGGLLTLPTQDIENQAQASFDRLCSHMGIPKETPSREKMELLRAVPAKSIADYVQSNWSVTFGPTIDEVLIDGRVQAWIEDSSRLDPGVKRVLIGMNRDEGTMFAPPAGQLGCQWSDIRARYGAASELDLLDRLYDQPGDGDPNALAHANTRIMTDMLFHAPILSFASMLCKVDRIDTSVYFFDCHVNRLEKFQPGLGASHALDMLYLFDSLPCRNLLSEDETKLGKELRNIWFELATSKTPSPDILPVVRRLWEDGQGAADTSVIIFRRDFTVGRIHVNWITKETFDYWMRFYDYQAERMDRGDYSQGFSRS